MILPEDSGVAYEMVCDELGYDAIGIPKTEEDVKKFEEYRDSTQLGTLIVASVPFDLYSEYDVSLAECNQQGLLETLFASIPERYAALKRR